MLYRTRGHFTHRKKSFVVRKWVRGKEGINEIFYPAYNVREYLYLRPPQLLSNTTDREREYLSKISNVYSYNLHAIIFDMPASHPYVHKD